MAQTLKELQQDPGLWGSNLLAPDALYNAYKADPTQFGAMGADPGGFKTRLDRENQKANNDAYAQGLQNQADKFRSNLPGYIHSQTESAGDQARQNLAQDIAGVKQNANARGLLYSGVNQGNQAAAKGFESGQLANKIQGINQSAHQTADTESQLAAGAFNSNAQQDISFAQIEEKANENAYTAHLQENAQRQQFYSGLLGGISGLAATAVLGVAKG